MPTESDWEDARRRFRGDAEHTGDDPLSGQFVDLATALFDVPGDEGVAGVVARIVDAAVRIIPGADVVSVFMTCETEYATVAGSDPVAERIDRVQYDRGEGPTLAAFETPGVALARADDIAEDDRWPTFCEHARSHGLRSVLATGMFPARGAARFGALTFYSRTAHGFGREDEEHALILAAHAATAISAAQVRTSSELLTAQLRTALDSRDVIGQAKGILMERRGLDADNAFDVLRRTSQDLNVKLRDVAATLVSRRAEL